MVKNSKQNSITNSSSITTNNIKPKLRVSSHQFFGQWPITVYTSGDETAYRIGRNQLKPMAPRMPVAKFAVGHFRVPNSDWTINVIPTRVDEPSSNNPARLELTMPCQS